MVAPVPRHRFRFVDLFAGIGGFHHAMASLGGECVLASEIDPRCQVVYRASFPDLPADRLVGDVRALTREKDGSPSSARQIAARVPAHDVLCAGFPCQPFSKSGAQEGVRDRTRGTLFFEIMEIVRARKPRYVILENVRNLAGPRHRETWALIIESLRDAGYSVSEQPIVVSPHRIPPAEGGAPQVRDRVFIIGERSPARYSPPKDRLLLEAYAFPEWDPSDWRIAADLLPDAAIPNVERYRLSQDELAWLEAWDAFVKAIPGDSLPGFPIWAFAFTSSPRIPARAPEWERDFLESNSSFYVENREVIDRWLKRPWGPARQRVRDFPVSRQKFEWQARKHHPTRQGRTIRDLVLQLRPSGIRVKPPTYLPALVAITQTSLVGPEVAPGINQYRRITPTEAAALQGLPGDTFSKAGVSDKDAYRQLGNAVNVGVAKLVACQLLESASTPEPTDVGSRTTHPLIRALGK